MLEVEFKPKKSEYTKYLFDLRFICQRITYDNKSMTFYKIWNEDGWSRTISLDNDYYTIEIGEVK